MAMSLGSIMKEKRHALGYSQAELSEKLGVSVQTISRWETNHGMPDISQIVPLAKLLCVSTDTLLGMELSEEEAIKEAYLEIQEMWSCEYKNDTRPLPEKKWSLQRACFEKLKKLTRKYPENDTLIFECTAWLVKYLDESYRLCKRDPEDIVSLCTDAERMLLSVLGRAKEVNFKADVKILLSQIYAHMGEREKAIEITSDLTYFEMLKCRYKQAIILSDHKEQIKVGKERFFSGFRSAAVGFASLYTAYSVIGGESRRLAIMVQKKYIEFIKLYEGTIPDFFYHYHLCEANGRLAIEYLRDSDFNECLNHIEKVCDNCCAIAAMALKKEPELNTEIFRSSNYVDYSLFGNRRDAESITAVLCSYIKECQAECTDKVSNPIVTSERYQNCLRRIEAFKKGGTL